MSIDRLQGQCNSGRENGTEPASALPPSRYDIVLPRIERYEGRAAPNCMAEVREDSPESHHVALRQIETLFSREIYRTADDRRVCGFDFGTNPDGKFRARGADKLGLLLVDENCSFHPAPAVGACMFVRHDPTAENWASDVRHNLRDKKPFWEFVWVWIHPYARREGRIRSALKHFREAYGGYRVYQPVSAAGAALCKAEKVRVLRQATRGKRR